MGDSININELSGMVVDCAYRVHKELGPGLLESVYEVVLADFIEKRGCRVERQIPIPIEINGKKFDEGFRADLIVNGIIVVEIKSVEQLAKVHKKQVLTYLRLGKFPLGLLINFGGLMLKGNIERIAAQSVPDLKMFHTECSEPTEGKSN